MMMKHALLAGVALAVSTAAAADPSSGRKDQMRGQAEMPVCTHKIGTLALVPPDKEWWRELNLGTPEAIIKVFVQQSGCFTLLNRDRAMQSRNMERALADAGELQGGSNMGKGQVKAADFFLQPDIVTANKNSGGGGVGAAAGALGGLFGGFGHAVGAIAGGINVQKGEANVTLSLVDARTTEESLTEGYARKTDISWGLGGGAGWWGGFAAAGGYGYQDTAIGQVIVLAYLDAYKKLVTQLGGVSPAPPPPAKERRAALSDEDRALHSERGVKGVGAFERVLAGGRYQLDVHRRMLRHLDRAAMDERLRGRGDASRREELRRGEIVPAPGRVDHVKHRRHACAKLKRVRLELEVGHRDGDGGGVLRRLGRQGSGDRGKGQCEKRFHRRFLSDLATAPSPTVPLAARPCKAAESISRHSS
jgi:curli biogenesis system outer membrane secretion channel CsgG